MSATINNLLLWYKYNSTNCTQMLADIIQSPSYITATCVLYTKHYITNCCTGYLITGTSGPGDGSNEGIPLCIHFEMLHKCFSNPIPGALVCNDHSLKLMLLLVLVTVEALHRKNKTLVCSKRCIGLLHAEDVGLYVYGVTFLHVGAWLMFHSNSLYLFLHYIWHP